MGLFLNRLFTSHSGKILPFKIDCAYLTSNDLECLAGIGFTICTSKLRFNSYNFVGVPTGGVKFASALNAHARSLCLHNPGILPIIVDDVYTTGASMLQHMKLHNTFWGLVIFSRAESLLPSVEAIFTLHETVTV